MSHIPIAPTAHSILIVRQAGLKQPNKRRGGYFRGTPNDEIERDSRESGMVFLTAKGMHTRAVVAVAVESLRRTGEREREVFSIGGRERKKDEFVGSEKRNSLGRRSLSPSPLSPFRFYDRRHRRRRHRRRRDPRSLLALPCSLA